MNLDENKPKTIAPWLRAVAVVALLALAIVLVQVYVLSPADLSTTQNETSNVDTVELPDDGVVRTAEGKQLYQKFCSSCHSDISTTAPSLKGVRDRIPLGDWKYYFVLEESSLLEKNDSYTIQINSRTTVAWAHFNPQLNRSDVDAILGYR